ncbi:class I SAM-dependent methyltransferase [Flavobacterium sp.]|uniref:class I SAM-dependent methyltransferase n=1 Tax=Flavobacterium sp. TaxID=239 RepID=UPI0031D935AC
MKVNKNNSDDGFLYIKLSYSNLDRYYIRTSILNALTKNLNRFDGKILDIGCGKMPYRNYILKNSEVTNYIGLDIEEALVYDSEIKPDFTWNGINMPFEDNSFDCAFGTEVLEHCPEPERILKEVYRVLKENGVFFFTVPFLWNLHEVPHDEYRYTPFSLQRHLENSGFDNIEIKALGGWHASMAQMMGLWVSRAPMSGKKRKILSLIIKPLIHYLIKKDKSLNTDFKEGQMITGLYGFAKK